MKPQYLYHGSRYCLNTIEPRQAIGFKDSDQKLAVYAVAEKALAIPFAFTIINASEQSIFNVNTDVNPPRIILEHCDYDWEKHGYLHKVSSRTFEQADELQWISYQPVEVLEVIKLNPKDYQGWVEYSLE